MKYDAWFEAKVKESLESDEPLIPHDVTMEMLREALDKKKEENNEAQV